MIDIEDDPIDCTGGAVVGDEVLFIEQVFAGAYRHRRSIGARRVAARVLRTSYGQERQQQTFSLEVVASDGVSALTAGTTVRRKGRNLYRHGTWRRRWSDEAERAGVATDARARAQSAHAARAERASGRPGGEAAVCRMAERSVE